MRWLALLALAGCGRFGFEARPDGGSGDSDGSGVMSTPIALDLPAGGEIDRIRVASDGRWYAVTSAGDVMRSDDNQTWVACGAIYAYDVGITADGNVFAAGPDVLESTDHCATWQPTNIDRFTDAIGISGNVVWGLVDNGLRQRVGGTWMAIATPLDGARFKTWSSRTGAPYLIGTNSGILSSQNGTSWAASTTGLDTENVVEIATSPTKTYAITQAGGMSSGAVGCSDGNATTWTTCIADGGTAIAVDPANDSHAFAAIYDTLTETTTGFATTLNERRGGDMGQSAVLDLAFLPDSSVLAAGDRGVFVAPPGTGTVANIAWQGRHTGLDAWNVGQIVRTGDELYLATEGGVIHDVVGQPYTVSITGMYSDTQVNGIAVAPDGTVIGAGRHIWTSSDHGATWTEQVGLDQIDNYRAYSVIFVGARAYVGTASAVYNADPPYTSWTRNALGHYANGLVYDGTTLWIASDAGVYTSPDGVAFHQVTGPPAGNFTSIAQLADGGIVACDANKTGTWISDPTRTTWQNVGPSMTVLKVAEAGGAIIAATDHGFYASHDRGMTWTLAADTQSVGVRGVLFDPADGKLVVGTIGRGILKSAIP